MSRKKRRNQEVKRDQETRKMSKDTLRTITPKTPNQTDYIISIIDNDVTLCTGPAGSGKTCLSIYMACQYLLDEKVDKIVVCKPLTPVGRKDLGALPGTMMEKMAPHLVNIIEEFEGIFGSKHIVQNKMAKGEIEVCPLEYMRGRNFHNSFIILDEAQNAMYEQLKMFVTRLGKDSKMVINGDADQTDLWDRDSGGFDIFLDKLQNVQGVGVHRLTNKDIVRNSLIGDILQALNS